MSHIAELRALVWDVAMQVDKLKKRPITEESKRLAALASENLKEAHLALFWLQLEINREEKVSA